MSQVGIRSFLRSPLSFSGVADVLLWLHCFWLGTAACYHGIFFCPNRGFEPKKLASAFVDDGVCGG
jgi:hypothetical protein